ncbi:MAG: hypothetical protein K0R02_609 [Rickettsiaceae bacterium]|jgi:hypothetical protein|nr:hypothetical protein [Rickettsiaceae bacterium]
MKQEDLDMLLHWFCQGNSVKSLKTLLKQSPEVIDVTIDDGGLFGLAIAHDYPEVLKVLVDYYEKTQMQGDPHSIEYIYARKKLHDIFQETVNGHGINSDEVRDILAKYGVYRDNFANDYGETSDIEERDRDVEEISLNDFEEHSDRENLFESRPSSTLLSESELSDSISSLDLAKDSSTQLSELSGNLDAKE